MKNLILFFTIAITLIACKKSKTSPETEKPASSATTASVTTNNWETPMAYDWKIFTLQSYVSNNLISTTTYTNHTDCHLLLTCNNSSNTAYPTAKEMTNGMNCNPIVGKWFVKEQDILTLDGQEYRIQSLINDTLVLTLGRSVSSYSQKYKLWK